MIKILWAALATTAVIGLLAVAAHNDGVRAALNDCIAVTAQNEGYTGNIYGSAWELFYQSCTK
jgi:hypothetical protein